MLSATHWFQLFYGRNLRIAFSLAFIFSWLVIDGVLISIPIKLHQQEMREVRSYAFDVKELAKPDTLAMKLRAAEDPVSKYVVEKASGTTRQLLAQYVEGAEPSEQLKVAMISELNRHVTGGRSLYDEGRFAEVKLSDDVKDLVKQVSDPKSKLKRVDIARMNRRLLEDAYPGLLVSQQAVVVAPTRISYAEMAPPPSLKSDQIIAAAELPEATPAAVEQVTSTVPLPVPDEQAEAATMQTQALVSGVQAPAATGGAGIGPVIIDTTKKVEVYDDNTPAPVTFKYMKASVLPTPLKDVAPEYPEKARALGLEGTAIIDMWLRKDGTVSIVQIKKSTGSELLDSAAVRAAAKSVFTPALGADGKPVNVWVERPFRFTLTGGN